MSDLKRRISFAATPEREVITNTTLLSNSPPPWDNTSPLQALAGGRASTTAKAAATNSPATTMVTSERQRHESSSFSSATTTAIPSAAINGVSGSTTADRRRRTSKRLGPRVDEREADQNRWPTGKDTSKVISAHLTRHSSTVSNLAATSGGVYLSRRVSDGDMEEVASASFYPTSLHRRKRQLQQELQEQHILGAVGGAEATSSSRRSISKERYGDDLTHIERTRGTSYDRQRSGTTPTMTNGRGHAPPTPPSKVPHHPFSLSNQVGITTTNQPLFGNNRNRVHSSDAVSKLRRSSSPTSPTSQSDFKRPPTTVPASTSLQPTIRGRNDNLHPGSDNDKTLLSPSPPRRVPVTITSSLNNSRSHDDGGAQTATTATRVTSTTTNTTVHSKPPPPPLPLPLPQDTSLQYYLSRGGNIMSTNHNESGASTIELNVSAASTAQPPHHDYVSSSSPPPLPHGRATFRYSVWDTAGVDSRRAVPVSSSSSCHHHSCRVGHCMLNQAVIAERIALEAAVTRLQSELEQQRRDLALQQKREYHRSTSPPPTKVSPSQPSPPPKNDDADTKIRLQENVIAHLEERLQEMERHQQEHSYQETLQKHHHHHQPSPHQHYTSNSSSPTTVPAMPSASPDQHHTKANTSSGLSRAEQWRIEMDAKFRRLHQRREEERSSSTHAHRVVAVAQSGKSGGLELGGGRGYIKLGDGSDHASAHTSGLNISAVSTGGASSTMSSRHAFTTTHPPTRDTVSNRNAHRHIVTSTTAPDPMSRAVALPSPNLDEAFRSIHNACDNIHYAATQVLIDIRQLEGAYTPTPTRKAAGHIHHQPHGNTYHHTSPSSSHQLHSSPSMPGIVSLHEYSSTSSTYEEDDVHSEAPGHRRATSTYRRGSSKDDVDLISPKFVVARSYGAASDTSAEVDI